MNICDLRTKCNNMGLSCRDSNGRYLPENALRSLIRQAGGKPPALPAIYIPPQTYITDVLYNAHLVVDPIVLINDILIDHEYNPDDFDIDIEHGAGAAIGIPNVDQLTLNYNGILADEPAQILQVAITNAFPALQDEPVPHLVDEGIEFEPDPVLDGDDE
jgi:hypothetical protein